MPDYRNPIPTVDIIIEIGDKIVLIERGGEPAGYAIPGGFVEEGETLETAAIREAKEETLLDVQLTDLLYVYSDPARDPRRHTISIVFIARASGNPRGSDDAKKAFLADEKTLPHPFAFDHALILSDYFRFKRTGKRPSPKR